MSGFVEGEDHHQPTLFPESLDEYIAQNSAVRVIDVFVDDFDISSPYRDMNTNRPFGSLADFTPRLEQKPEPSCLRFIIAAKPEPYRAAPLGHEPLLYTNIDGWRLSRAKQTT